MIVKRSMVFQQDELEKEECSRLGRSNPLEEDQAQAQDPKKTKELRFKNNSIRENKSRPSRSMKPRETEKRTKGRHEQRRRARWSKETEGGKKVALRETSHGEKESKSMFGEIESQDIRLGEWRGRRSRAERAENRE